MLVLALQGCADKSSVAPEIEPQALSIEELNAFAQNLTFVGELPSGVSVDFSPREMFSSSPESNYVESPRNYFSDMGNGITMDVGDLFSASFATFSFAEADLDFLAEFQYILITTYGELADMYPELDVDPFLDPLMIAIAIGSDQYDAGDVIDGETFGVTDFLIVQEIGQGFLFGAFYREEAFRSEFFFDEFIDFEGPFALSENQLTSQGDARLEILDRDSFDSAIFGGNYTLDLRQ